MEKKSKKVVMPIKNVTTKESPKELSYEQLERIVVDLNSQCRQLAENLRNAERVISEFNDLGMLVSIISNGEYFSPAFIERCTREVEDIVTRALDNSAKVREAAKLEMEKKAETQQEKENSNE